MEYKNKYLKYKSKYFKLKGMKSVNLADTHDKFRIVQIDLTQVIQLYKNNLNTKFIDLLNQITK